MMFSLFSRRRFVGVIALLTAVALLIHLAYLQVSLFSEDGHSLESLIDPAPVLYSQVRGTVGQEHLTVQTDELRSSLPPLDSIDKKQASVPINASTLQNASNVEPQPIARLPHRNSSSHHDTNDTPSIQVGGEKPNSIAKANSSIPLSATNQNRSRNHRTPSQTATVHRHEDIVSDKLPGVFANNSIFLQTIRLTTSYQTSIHDLHVDLFGFSGDAARPHIQNFAPFCTDIPQNFNQTLLGRQELRDDVKLFCQLDLNNINHQNSSSSSSSFSGHPTPPNLLKMFFLPMASVDFAQTIGTVIWRCNVTGILNKPQLIQYIDDYLLDGKANPTVTVHIWIRHKLRKQVTRLATFQIPLETGSLGVGSVHIRGGSSGAAKTYFHQAPVAAGLCIAIYGKRPLLYLSQFVQHHLNVGFGSIVVGVKGPEHGYELKQAQKLLQRYMDQGVVSLAHYSSPFSCDRTHGTQVDQMQFYQPCLYHHKGLTKYSATWDIDEFWTPPETLHVDGRHVYKYFQMGVNKIMTPDNATAIEPNVTINASSWSTFPRTIQNDPIWQQSWYAKSVSISDTFDAIDRYYVEHGCNLSFCFHMFPSRVAWHRESVVKENTSISIGQDFEMRKVGYDDIWQKSVVNTHYAHMSGIHVPGSCFFEDSLDTNLSYSLIEKKFHSFANTEVCNPRRFEHEIYGSIHHFVNLISFSRWPLGAVPNDNVTQPDEYVSLYAKTVDSQLARDEDK